VRGCARDKPTPAAAPVECGTLNARVKVSASYGEAEEQNVNMVGKRYVVEVALPQAAEIRSVVMKPEERHCGRRGSDTA